MPLVRSIFFPKMIIPIAVNSIQIATFTFKSITFLIAVVFLNCRTNACNAIRSFAVRPVALSTKVAFIAVIQFRCDKSSYCNSNSNNSRNKTTTTN